MLMKSFTSVRSDKSPAVKMWITYVSSAICRLTGSYLPSIIRDIYVEINFVTKNPHKAREVETILGDIGVSIVHAPLTIHEIQT
jgi:hypothetical protein